MKLSAPRLGFALVVVLAAFSNMVLADSLTVGGPVTGTTLTIKDSALTALNSGWANGVTAYIDPYRGTLNGQSVILFCVDPNHLDNTSSYPVNISQNGAGNNTLQSLNLTGGGVLPGSQTLSQAAIAAGFTSATQLYGGLAWLSQQLQSSSNALTQQEYQAAIWQLADYTSTFQVVNPPMNFDGSLVNTFELNAKANALTSGFSVLTDANEVSNGRNAAQEYIILTPEPSSALLSVSGLVGLIGLRRRSKMAQA